MAKRKPKTIRERLILLLGGTLKRKRKEKHEPCPHGSFYGKCKICPPWRVPMKGVAPENKLRGPAPENKSCLG